MDSLGADALGPKPKGLTLQVRTRHQAALVGL